MPTNHRTTKKTCTWTGRFLTIRDLWTLTNAQIRTAVTLDELADEDGRVDLPRATIARVAGVSGPRVSEAADALASRGLLEPFDRKNTTRGYRLLTEAERSPSTPGKEAKQ